jgi:hypothetical protein
MIFPDEGIMLPKRWNKIYSSNEDWRVLDMQFDGHVFKFVIQFLIYHQSFNKGEFKEVNTNS